MRVTIRVPAQAAADAGGGSGTAVVDDAAAKAAADKVVVDKAAAEKAVADKAIAEKAIADKAVADKTAADKAAGKTPEQVAADNASAEAAAAAAKAQPPAKYALTLPAGGRLDQSDLQAVEALARAAGWTNDDAQAAIAEHDSLVQAQSERFLAETTADKDYGGDKLAESQRLANLVIDRVRPKGHPRREGFMRLLHRGGANNHIEAVSFFADLGKTMAEDTSTGGRGGGGGDGAKDAATVLYGGEK